MAILLGRVGYDTEIKANPDDPYGCNLVYYIGGGDENPNPLPPEYDLLFKPQYGENIQKLLDTFYKPNGVGLSYLWIGGDGVEVTWTGSGQTIGAGGYETYKDKTCPTVLNWVFSQNVQRTPAYPDGQSQFSDTIIIEYVSLNRWEDAGGNVVDGFKYVVDWETKEVVGVIPHISITIYPGSQYANPEYFSNVCDGPYTGYNGTLNLFGFLSVPIFPTHCSENGQGPTYVNYTLSLVGGETNMKTDK